MNPPNWAAWLALAMLSCALTYNPLYQAALLIVLSAVAALNRRPLGAYLKAGLLMSALPLTVNVLLVHQPGTALYTVPMSANVLGVKIPLLFLAGPVTAETVAFALIVTALLLNMLLAFQLFSDATGADAMIRLIPGALPAAALASSIALRFVPTVMKDYSNIRDAQLSRGLNTDSGPISRRIGNQLGIIAPTVVTSLERGFNVAESMASRGYTGARTTYRRTTWDRRERLIRWILLSAIAVELLAKLSGALDFWPYDSKPLPPLSALALLPIITLIIPAILKDESDTDN